jgi:hypothetical protein
MHIISVMFWSHTYICKKSRKSLPYGIRTVSSWQNLRAFEFLVAHTHLFEFFCTMSQSRSLSKVAAAGLIVGASCFVQCTVFESRQSKLVELTVDTKGAGGLDGLPPWKNVPPFVEIRGGQTMASTQQSLLHATTRTADQSEGTIRRMAASYSLLWSPGFLPKLGLSTAVIAGLHASGVAGRMGTFLWCHWNSSAWVSSSLRGVVALGFPNVVLPLLSSSCCLVQLIINALVGAGGCAGFNTVLGPLRPSFLSLLAYLNWVARPPLGTGFMRLSLALLPEIVDIWNQWLTESMMKQRSKELPVSSAMIQAVIEVEIPTMGCVACINKIDKVLRQTSPEKILHASSWLDPEREKGGRARVRCAVHTQDELNDILSSILGSIEEVGFSGPVISGWYLVDEQ